MMHLIALAVGFVLDYLLGDPYTMPHIIRLIGNLIAGAERAIRAVLPTSKTGERLGGLVLVLVVTGISCEATVALLRLARDISPWLMLALDLIRRRKNKHFLFAYFSFQ